MLGPGIDNIRRCGPAGVGVALGWVWPCWNRYGFVRVSVALLEGVWPCCRKCITVELGFETFLLATWKRVFSCLPLKEDVELLAFSHMYEYNTVAVFRHTRRGIPL